MSRAKIETAPEVDARAALTAEVDALSIREREAGEALQALRARPVAIDAEAAAAAVADDAKKLEALGNEVASFPAQLRIAEAGYSGISAALAEKAGRLGVLNRERAVSNLCARRVVVETSAAENAALVGGAVESLGRLIAERQGIETEMDSLRRQLAQYDVNAAPVPRVHEVIEEASRLMRTRARFDTIELRIPVPV